jgi:hypothetical protein
MSNLAEMAIELARASDDAELHACAYACELEAMAAGAARSRLMVLAARIGLSADATGKVLDDYATRARLMRAAGQVIRHLIGANAQTHPSRP